MPLRIGLVAYPAFLIALQLARPSAVGAFEKARSYTPETSRRPASLQVPLKAVRRAVRKGLLVPVGDGRYYLNQSAVRRRDRRTMAIFAASLVVVALLVWLTW